MRMDMITLERGSTRLRMMDPRAEEPYYRGTRFDRTGIILGLESGGHRYVQPWQRHYDPWSHDAVSGPAEEFLPIEAGKSDIGGVRAAFGVTQPQRSEDGRSRMRSGSADTAGWLKIGVGLLRDDGAPYDRFKLYDILDPGQFTVCFGQADYTGGQAPLSATSILAALRLSNADSGARPAGPEPSSVTFRHKLTGHYDYVKTVEIPADGRLRLTHALRNDSPDPIDTYVYCHNFFILDGAPTSRATRYDFPWRPVGDWRAPYDSVRLTEHGITFDRDLRPDETVFMGNLRPDNPTASGYRFILRNTENGLGVEAFCDRQMEYAVFWSNSDVSCLEPYIPLHLNPGQTARWTLDYRFL